MRYLAAYLLLQIGGKAAPTADDIKSVLGAVGIDADEERLSKLLSELEGKDVSELVAEGSAKFASVPSGGGAAAAPVSGAGAGGGAAVEAPKEEEKKEEEAESDDDMGFGLFD
ncbi:ribosomal protein, large P2 [Phellopilus nigrolimitatus]|nr:ribosomal protein, large P2 [Phellopilus nigrolimitatus]